MNAREALEKIAARDIGDFKEPIDGDSSALYQNAVYKDDKFLGTKIPVWYGAYWYRQLKEVITIAKEALEEPLRNCDKYPDFNNAITVLAKKRGWTGTRWNSERYCILANWLLATEERGA